jgi:hypothetical protein
MSTLTAAAIFDAFDNGTRIQTVEGSEWYISEAINDALEEAENVDAALDVLAAHVAEHGAVDTDHVVCRVWDCDGANHSRVVAVGVFRRYLVRLGGSPPDSAEDFDSADDAVAAAFRMAREVCELNWEGDDLDPDDLDEWGGPGEEGWGVCPSNDDGGYWPHITESA